ncbi:MAG: YgiQ family radical SAM protein [Dysgonamonadaceae bacterium]|nr:YgiQ family radical SAM protein [Dysgonamonadaceae bacterium]
MKLTDWLPTTKKEVELRGWDELDVILFSGDAYVDHPSFGTAVLGHLLESMGLKVAIVPQPNWRDDLRDFKKLGKPRLFFGVSAGAMDSMVNKYTANKRLRSDDAYTPDARVDMRPEYPTLVYTKILKDIFPDTPVIIGGIEASLRRLSHYDYWQDKLLPSILIDSQADILVYGSGEKPIKAIAEALQNGTKIEELDSIPQTVIACHCEPRRFVIARNEANQNYQIDVVKMDCFEQSSRNDARTRNEGNIILHSFEDCLKDKRKQAENFRHIEEESNKIKAVRLLQQTGQKTVVVNPPYPVATTKEVDACYDLPYTRLPHPKYKDKRIPAYEMIRHSVTIHRGCFGGCAFCTISAHQGKFIASRSKESVLKEVKAITEMLDFKGYISDLGGPSANMYDMKGKESKICESCKKPSCIFPQICKNLDANHKPLLELYQAVDKIPGVKKSFIGSGIRYDLLVNQYDDGELSKSARDYTQELISKHVSGRLKVAPEHTSHETLACIRKPDFSTFYQFKKIFDKINKEQYLNQQLIPYFMSSHPACTEIDMAELAIISKSLNFQLEQVQDFTPTPMTLSSEIYYSGIHPYTMKPVYTAKSKEEKLNQRQYFFWYNRDYKNQIAKALNRLKRPDLLKKLYL